MDSSLDDRLRSLVISYLKVEDLDKFLRLCKSLMLNSAKKLYGQLLDWILMVAVANPQEVKVKKEVFKQVNEQSDQNTYTCLLMLAVMVVQVVTAIEEVEALVTQVVVSWQERELEEKAAMSQKERKLMERRHELFVKNM